MKIAMPVKFEECKECTRCHSFATSGFLLMDDSLSRFVCTECYSFLYEEYPLANKTVNICKSELEKFVPENKTPGFHAGYLLGKKEKTRNGYSIVVKCFLDSVKENKGTACFFDKEDTTRIRRLFKEKGWNVVGLYRTNPSGSSDFNTLDKKVIEDMLFDIIYMVIGGRSEIQIGVADKSNTSDKIGVIIS